MAKQFIPTNKGPAIIKSMNSNTLSDAYRDQITIAYQFIGSIVPDISFDWHGRTFDTPVMAGPIGGYQNGGPDGLLKYAQAVKEAGSIFWTGFHDPEGWAQVLEAEVPAVRVIKPLADNNAVLDAIRFDTEHGAVGYAMDIDHGLTVYGELDGQQQPFSSKTIDDISLFAHASDLPFYLKGIMSVRDALAAKEAGVSGIVVSGHNNRFPCAVPPLKILPAIRAAVGDDLKILLDGGMQTGYDVFKAFALGADGVLCARGLMVAFVKDGAEGLEKKILEISAELKGALANTGSTDLKHVNKESVILP